MQSGQMRTLHICSSIWLHLLSVCDTILFNTIAFPRSHLPPIPVSLCSFHKMGHCAGQIHGDSDIAGLGVNINSPLISLMR